MAPDNTPPRRRRTPLGLRAAAVALVLAALLAGCGGGTRTVVESGPPKTSPATTPGATTGAASGKTTPATATTGEGEPPSRVVRLATFQSPSGNIRCAIAGGVARCDIVERSWQPPPRPQSCPQEVDFGQGLEVDAHSHGRLVCAGDTARDPTSAKLEYGTAAQAEGLTCTSRRTGVTCTDTDGHGFDLSRQGYRVF
jgi:hypothetical protein